MRMKPERNTGELSAGHPATGPFVVDPDTESTERDGSTRSLNTHGRCARGVRKKDHLMCSEALPPKSMYSMRSSVVRERRERPRERGRRSPMKEWSGWITWRVRVKK
jgi:hypothetical protein